MPIGKPYNEIKRQNLNNEQLGQLFYNLNRDRLDGSRPVPVSRYRFQFEFGSPSA